MFLHLLIYSLAIFNTIVNAANNAEVALEEVFLKDDQEHTWSSPKFPNPYPAQSQTLIVSCDKGFSVSTRVDTLDLDGERGDFLVIKPGTTLDSNTKGKVFTYKLNSNRTYLINANQAIFSLQVYGENKTGKKGFSLTYKRFGELDNSPTEPPITPPAPMPDVNILVYVSGKSIAEFSTPKVQLQFKEAVSQMAIEYCNSNNFTLTKEITHENVQMRYLTDCPFSWPDHNICTKIGFAVPVDVPPNSSYQLTAYHLNQMWRNLGNQYLEKYNMKIYTQPGHMSTIKWWIIILCSTIVLFSVILYLLKTFGANIPLREFRKKAISGIKTSPNQIRGNTFTPTSHQYSTPSMHEDYPYKKCDLPQTTKNCTLSDEEDDCEVFSRGENNFKRITHPTTNESYT